MVALLTAFTTIWLVDFEYTGPMGERPTPVCVVAHELRSGRKVRVWEDDLRRMTAPPYDVGQDSLFVAYYASAELGCHLVLGWPMPANVLDLFSEFRLATNGLHLPSGSGLLGALVFFGLDAMPGVEKATMRTLVLRGGPWTDGERASILDYCQNDVVALARLLPRMVPDIDVPRALLRGRYMAAAARIEHVGVPIDQDALAIVREHWRATQDRLIAEIDRGYRVFEERTFKASRWETWLADRNIAWPRLESGQLDLKEDTFRQMAKVYPEIAPMHELRATLSRLRPEQLAVGSDGRNRCILSAFGARTGRNTPSARAFVFGPAVWIRHFIRPEAGRTLAYLDWSQQEFGIVAALSRDPAMMAAYTSGDPYMKFACLAGAAPADATKESHGAVRERFKQCSLAVLYAMGEAGLAARIGIPITDARELLRQHRGTFPNFWRWSDAALDHAMQFNTIHTVFGWRVHCTRETRVPSLRNFLAQGNGAEMLRLACCLATERGIRVCAPVHDALLVEADEEQLDSVVAATRCAMTQASHLVLDGFELRTDVKVIRHPERFRDPRGETMWRTVTKLVGIEPEENA